MARNRKITLETFGKLLNLRVDSLLSRRQDTLSSGVLPSREGKRRYARRVVVLLSVLIVAQAVLALALYRQNSSGSRGQSQTQPSTKSEYTQDDEVFYPEIYSEERAAMVEKLQDVELLTERLASGDNNVRWQVLGELSRLTRDEKARVVPSLLSILEGSNIPAHIRAVDALVSMGEDVIPLVLPALQDPQASLQMQLRLMNVLLAIESPGAEKITVFVNFLQSDVDEIRSRAINALLKLGALPKKDIPPLLNAVRRELGYSSDGIAETTIADILEASRQEDGTLPSRLVDVLIVLGPGVEEALPSLTRDLELHKNRVSKLKVHDQFILRSGRTIEAQKQTEAQDMEYDIFINVDMIGQRSHDALTPALEVHAAIRSIQGAVTVGENGLKQYSLAEPSDIGLNLNLIKGDAVWLWAANRQWKANIQSFTIRAGGNFSGIGMTLRTQDEIPLQSHAVMSLVPFPEQTWQVAEPTETDQIVAQSFVEQLSQLYVDERPEVFTDKDSFTATEPHTVLINTQTQGSFMVINGAGIAAGEGVESREVILQRKGAGAWQKIAGPHAGSGKYSQPFVDIDGDGIPEFLQFIGYIGGLDSIYPESKEILSYSEGV